MLTQDLRPVKLTDVAGQKNIKTLLKKIISEPLTTPNTLLFRGPYGTGKTTCARILARELNKVKTLDNQNFYKELNMAQYSADDLRNLADDLYVTSKNNWTVVVLDELQTLSPQAQAVLLKVFEEAPPRIKFIICTTEIKVAVNDTSRKGLLPTIVSRSLVFDFRLISDTDMTDYLNLKADELGIPHTDKQIALIVDKAMGHPRNAVMLLDALKSLGADFESCYPSITDVFGEYYNVVQSRNLQALCPVVEKLFCFPLVEITRALDNFLKREIKKDRPDILFISLAFNDVVLKSYNNDIRFQTALLWIGKQYNSEKMKKK